MTTSDEFEAYLDATLVVRPAIEQAKGILVGALCDSPEGAQAELRRVAEEHGVDLTGLASALVETAAGGTPADPLLRKIIWQEWSEVLPDCET